jgi:hypothetical protein
MKGSKRVDVTKVGCGVIDGTKVCRPVSHVRGGSECHRAKGDNEGLQVPLP